jgi:hypothetical protein
MISLRRTAESLWTMAHRGRLGLRVRGFGRTLLGGIRRRTESLERLFDEIPNGLALRFVEVLELDAGSGRSPWLTGHPDPDDGASHFDGLSAVPDEGEAKRCPDGRRTFRGQEESAFGNAFGPGAFLAPAMGTANLEVRRYAQRLATSASEIPGSLDRRFEQPAQLVPASRLRVGSIGAPTAPSFESEELPYELRDPVCRTCHGRPPMKCVVD